MFGPLGRAAGRRLLVRAAPSGGWQQQQQRGLAAAAAAAPGIQLEGYHKSSTGLVGLKANPNARVDLIAQQKALLEKIKVRVLLSLVVWCC